MVRKAGFARDYASGRLLEVEKHLGKPWTLIAAVALGYPATEGRTPPKLTVDEVTEFLE